MSKLIIMSPSAISWNSVYRQTQTARRSAHSGGLEANDNPSHALPDKQPGTSAASNQCRAFLKPPCVAAGRIHSVYDNLPATSSTHASIKTSFTLSHNPTLLRLTAKNKRPWSRVNKCSADCYIIKTKVAVYFFQDRPTKRLPIVCDKTNNGKFCQMSRPLSDTNSEKFEIIKHRISVTH